MSAPAPLSKQALAKIDSVLKAIPVPCIVDFSRIAEVRATVDCDAYWKRATESQRKKVEVAVPPLPDMSKLKIQENVPPATVKAIEQEDFSDLAIKNPSQRLREKARRRSQQITVEPEVKKPVAAPVPVKAVPKPSTATTTAKPILSARDRRVVRPAEPTTSRYEPYSTTTRSSSTTRAIPPPSAPITRSMARRSASTAGTKDPVVPAIRPRRSDSVKSDSQPALSRSRRSESNSTTAPKSGLSRRPSNVINYFLSEKTIDTVASIGRKLRSVSKGRS